MLQPFCTACALPRSLSPCRWAFEGLLALALRPFDGGDDVLAFYFGERDAEAPDPLAEALVALGLRAAAVWLLILAALAKTAPACVELAASPTLEGVLRTPFRAMGGG